jgi:phytoene desaturase
MRALVIGAGPGGLFAALNLRSLGVDVTVVEKEAVPGGRMRGLSMGPYDVDTGPSIMQLPQILERIFRRAGKRIEDYVTLKRLPENTRIHFWDGSKVDTTWQQQQMRDEVEGLKPGLGAAYDGWLAEQAEKYPLAYEKFISHPADSLSYYSPLRLLPTLKYKPWQTLYSHLNSHFHDDRLSYAFSYPSKYLGLHPTTCSSVFSVIPYLELAFGVWHVMGGFRALAHGLKRCGEDLGITYRMSTPVAQVLADNGVATGARLESGEVVTADIVVVNADLPYAATTLIRPEARANTRLSDEALAKAKYSCSTFMLYLGLDTVYRDLPHHLIYLSNGARRTDRAALNDIAADLDDPPFYALNPTVTDPSGAPAGHSTLYVLVPTPNTHNNVDWKNVEATLAERVPQWLEKVGLRDVKKHIKAQRAFTAQTWRDDFNVHRGAVFNLSHTWLQLGPMRPKVESPNIRGLYWVGGGTHPGSGLLTIMESANICAWHVGNRIGTPLASWPYVPPLGSLPTSDDAEFPLATAPGLKKSA